MRASSLPLIDAKKHGFFIAKNPSAKPPIQNKIKKINVVGNEN